MFLNLSNPKPIIVAAKVPPNTITKAGKRKMALNEPPSSKKAPNIETKPRINPLTVPNFFINNPITI